MPIGTTLVPTDLANIEAAAATTVGGRDSSHRSAVESHRGFAVDRAGGRGSHPKRFTHLGQFARSVFLQQRRHASGSVVPDRRIDYRGLSRGRCAGAGHHLRWIRRLGTGVGLESEPLVLVQVRRGRPMHRVPIPLSVVAGSGGESHSRARQQSSAPAPARSILPPLQISCLSRQVQRAGNNPLVYTAGIEPLSARAIYCRDCGWRLELRLQFPDSGRRHPGRCGRRYSGRRRAGERGRVAATPGLPRQTCSVGCRSGPIRLEHHIGGRR